MLRTLNSLSSEKPAIPENRAGAKCPKCGSKRLLQRKEAEKILGICSECHFKDDAATFMSTEHLCHAMQCDTVVKPEMLFCKKHWFMVPKRTRDEVWRTYRPGQCDDKHPSEEWHRAADAAIRAVAVKEGFVKVEA